MIDCHACSWRLLRAICRDGPLTPVSYLSPRKKAFRSQSYNFSTYNGQQPPQAATHNSQFKQGQKGTRQRRPDQRGELAVALPNSNSRFDIERSSVHNHLKRELPWLKDPLKLLERTKALLEEGNQFKALELVRMASKEGQVAICWNRIIQHLLLHKQTTEALKVYNEMKKRAQFPDAFTYSIILKGLSDNTGFNAVPTAVSIFNSMTGPTSRVRPGIIHTNSALRVCARKGDLEAMWAIAGTIPEDGPQAADATTYTTILNAIRFSAEKQPTHLRSNPQVVEIQDKAVLQARQIWEDIAGRWYRGKIIVDETLVCAMGHILLMGSRPQDWDDVYSLVEQTTNIWRQAPHLRSGAKTDHKGQVLPYSTTQLVRTPVDNDGPDAGGEFDPVPQSISLQRATLRGSKSASLRYVKPSNNTLSILLEASLKLYLKRTADEYWTIFTDPEGLAVQPDEDNFHIYLRVLRQARGSSQAVKLVRDQMTNCEPKPKTYRLAMSTCIRNQGSPGVIKDASDLMDLMQARLPQMDVRTCIMWMELAMKSPHTTDVYAAIERLGPQNIDLMNIARTGDIENRAHVVTLLKIMLGGIDRLRNAGVLREEQVNEFEARRTKLNSLISKLMDNDEWRSQGQMFDKDIWAIRKGKKVDRFARKQEVTQARKWKLDIETSKKRFTDSRNSWTKTQNLKTKIEDSKTGTEDLKEGVQAIKELRQRIRRLKKSLPDPKKPVREDDAFSDFEHDLVFK